VRLVLKDFQEDLVNNLVDEMREASQEVGARGREQAVVLSAPTGSGKTVIITAALERIITGDDRAEPDPDAVFLWLSDLPELNVQSRARILAVSDEFHPASLRVIDASFVARRLEPGGIYFLNTQKLGRDRTLVTRQEGRPFSIWETIANTINDAPRSLYVVIDEAHRGMQESPRRRDEAATIVQRFIKGSNGVLPPVPIVVGLSATPQRFASLLSGTQRVSRPVTADVEAVRESGLLKDIIKVFHPDERQPSDLSLLAVAAKSWQEMEREWSVYCQSAGEEVVRPLIIVQVEDAAGNRISRSPLVEACETIESEVGQLPPEAYAHAFQEGMELQLGNRRIRYLPSSAINDDSDVRVVFFKSSLNTGWDCPRAEVMMSFRGAKDATLIAQLIGRLLRAPLARRVDSVEKLNTVGLFLPHYDEESLNSVLEHLRRQDPETLGPVTTALGQDIISCRQTADYADCVAVAASLPSYVVPTIRRATPIRRLAKLARALSYDGLLPDAPAEERQRLVDVMEHWRSELSADPTFSALIDDAQVLDVRSVEVHTGSFEEMIADALPIPVRQENVDDLFEWAARRIDAALVKAYWRRRALADPSTATSIAKLEAYAIAASLKAIDALHLAARDRSQELLDTYANLIGTLPEGRQQHYWEIRGLADSPEAVSLGRLPHEIEERSADAKWPKHLLQDNDGMYPAKLNRWETQVVGQELGREDSVAWLRNPVKKHWSMTIPYDHGGVTRPMYPDFIFFRRAGDSIVADLVDPHDVARPDAPAKAVGLARFANRHGLSFGRVELVIIDGHRMHTLDLKDEGVRNRVLRVDSQAFLRDLLVNG
jgi:type III restriction enzyme